MTIGILVFFILFLILHKEIFQGIMSMMYSENDYASEYIFMTSALVIIAMSLVGCLLMGILGGFEAYGEAIAGYLVVCCALTFSLLEALMFLYIVSKKTFPNITRLTYVDYTIKLITFLLIIKLFNI